MAYTNEVEKVIAALRLSSSELAEDQLGTLALIRAASELIRSCPDESDSGHPFRTLLRWIQVVNPKATARDARRVADSAHPTKDPQWLHSFHFDLRISAAFPAALLVAGLVATIPPGHSHLDAAWNYVQLAGQRIGVSRDDIEMFQGWIAGAASESLGTLAESRLTAFASANPLCEQIVGLLREHADHARASFMPRGAPPFLDARDRVLERVDVVMKHADLLNIDRTDLLRLKEYAAQDYFRIAILGEFKRGKSTLVNALVEAPDLMPADVLPCTSALTELRYDTTRRYFVVDASTGRSREEPESAFRGDVSKATEMTSTAADAQERASAVPRWRVNLPSPFLRQDFVELIDSPGLGEDPARDCIAREEALRADAAILLLSATQLASQRELDLVEAMKAKLENLVLAVNQADLISEAQWVRLQRHVRTRLTERGLPIPEDRIVFVSARNAEEAVREGRLSDAWLERTRQLRAVVRQHLIARSGPLKAQYLATRIFEVVRRGRAEVEAALAHRKEQLGTLNRLGTDHERAQREYRDASAAIKQAAANLLQHDVLAMKLWGAFGAALPKILDDVGQTRGDWTTDHNPLGSPKRHVEAVAERAKAQLLGAVENWFKGPGAEILGRALEEKLDAAAAEVESLRTYIETVRGQGSQEREAFVVELKERSLQSAYEEAARDASKVSAFGRAVVVAVIAVVVGYIIADVLLFYVLGVIAGFLAWPLLIAAAVAGIVLGSTKGKDLTERWVRNKVFEEIGKSFTKEEARQKMRQGIFAAMRDVCARLASGFEASCMQLLEEARHQELRVYEELTAFAARAGDRGALETEVARLEAAAAEVLRAYDELEHIAKDIRRDTATQSHSSGTVT